MTYTAWYGKSSVITVQINSLYSQCKKMQPVICTCPLLGLRLQLLIFPKHYSYQTYHLLYNPRTYKWMTADILKKILCRNASKSYKYIVLLFLFSLEIPSVLFAVFCGAWGHQPSADLREQVMQTRRLKAFSISGIRRTQSLCVANDTLPCPLPSRFGWQGIYRGFA